MRRRHPPFAPCRAALPAIWLVSDRRNDTMLEPAIRRLPRGSGLIFRHYHLPPDQRRIRFAALARMMRHRGGLAVLAGTMAQARAWRADGAYGSASSVARGGRGLRLITAHSLREMARGRLARADALVLSPVFPTSSHPGAAVLGPLRWRLLAATHDGAVLALGGMDAARARRIGARHWAAIDGLTRNEKKGVDHRGEAH